MGFINPLRTGNALGASICICILDHPSIYKNRRTSNTSGTQSQNLNVYFAAAFVQSIETRGVKSRMKM